MDLKVLRFLAWDALGNPRWGGTPKMIGELNGYHADLPISGLSMEVDARTTLGQYNTITMTMPALWSGLGLSVYDCVQVLTTQDGVTWTPRGYGDIRVPGSPLSPDRDSITLVGLQSETSRFGEVTCSGSYGPGDLSEIARLLVNECVDSGRLKNVLVPDSLPPTGASITRIDCGHKTLRELLDTLMALYNTPSPGSPEPEFPVVCGVGPDRAFFFGLQDGTPMKVDARHLKSVATWKRPDGEKPCTRVIWHIPCGTLGYRFAERVEGSERGPYQPMNYLVHEASSGDPMPAERVVPLGLQECQLELPAGMKFSEYRLDDPQNMFDGDPDTYATSRAYNSSGTDVANSIILKTTLPEHCWGLEFVYSTANKTDYSTDTEDDIYVGVDVGYAGSSLLMISRVAPTASHSDRATIKLAFPPDRRDSARECTDVDFMIALTTSTPADWLRLYRVSFFGLDTARLDANARLFYYLPEENVGSLRVSGIVPPNRRLMYRDLEGGLHEMKVDSLEYAWLPGADRETTIKVGQRDTPEERFYWRSIQEKKLQGATLAVQAGA